jgi:hypothetical protein
LSPLGFDCVVEIADVDEKLAIGIALNVGADLFCREELTPLIDESRFT